MPHSHTIHHGLTWLFRAVPPWAGTVFHIHTGIMPLHVHKSHKCPRSPRRGAKGWETGDLAIKYNHQYVMQVVSAHTVQLKPVTRSYVTWREWGKYNSPVPQNRERTGWTPVRSTKKYTWRKRKARIRNIKFTISFLNLSGEKITFPTVKKKCLFKF